MSIHTLIKLQILAIIAGVVALFVAYAIEDPTAAFGALFALVLLVSWIVETIELRARQIANCMARHPAGGRR